MLTQYDFLKKLGICYNTLHTLQEQGLFMPVSKSVTGRRIYYSEE